MRGTYSSCTSQIERLGLLTSEHPRHPSSETMPSAHAFSWLANAIGQAAASRSADSLEHVAELAAFLSPGISSQHCSHSLHFTFAAG